MLLEQRLGPFEGLEKERGTLLGLFPERKARNQNALSLEALAAVYDSSFAVLEVLAAEAHVRFFCCQQAKQIVPFERIEGIVQLREVDLDVALGHEDVQRRHRLLPSREPQNYRDAGPFPTSGKPSVTDDLKRLAGRQPSPVIGPQKGAAARDGRHGTGRQRLARHLAALAFIFHTQGHDRLTPRKLTLAFVVLVALAFVPGGEFGELNATGVALAVLASLAVS
ncbi:MAG: hypothetical protein AB7F22_28785 [Reyranella sp.]|uniref:hypothetical protein n=1 Tax=Reyranella sp. TaxID=1929291 RepID=UPI003D0FD516